MSTDYGFGCVTCGYRESGGWDNGWLKEMAIIENCRDVELLGRVIEVVGAGTAQEILRLNTAGLDVGLEWPADRSNAAAAIRFLAEHVVKGHEVKVADEYGRTIDTCHGHAICAACGDWKPCSLPDGHEGEHAKRKAGGA